MYHFQNVQMSPTLSDLTHGHIAQPPLSPMYTQGIRVGNSHVSYDSHFTPPMNRRPEILTGLQMHSQRPSAYDMQPQCQIYPNGQIGQGPDINPTLTQRDPNSMGIPYPGMPPQTLSCSLTPNERPTRFEGQGHTTPLRSYDNSMSYPNHDVKFSSNYDANQFGHFVYPHMASHYGHSRAFEVEPSPYPPTPRASQCYPTIGTPNTVPCRQHAEYLQPLSIQNNHGNPIQQNINQGFQSQPRNHHNVESAQPVQNVDLTRPSQASSMQSQQLSAEFEAKIHLIPDRFLKNVHRDETGFGYYLKAQNTHSDSESISRLTSPQESKNVELMNKGNLTNCNSLGQMHASNVISNHELKSQQLKQSSTCVQENYSCPVEQPPEKESKNFKLQSKLCLKERSTKVHKKFNTQSQMTCRPGTSEKASQCDLSSVLPITTNSSGSYTLETHSSQRSQISAACTLEPVHSHSPVAYTLESIHSQNHEIHTKDPSHLSRLGMSTLEPSSLGSHARARVHSHSPGLSTPEPNSSGSSAQEVSHTSRPGSDTNTNYLSSTISSSHSNGPMPDSNFKYLYSPRLDASELNHMSCPGPSALENNYSHGPGTGSNLNPSSSPRLDAPELSPSRPGPGASELRHSPGSKSTKVSSRRLDASELSPSRPGPGASELRHSPRSTLTQLSSRRLDASELSPSRPGPCALETSPSHHSYCNTEINHMGSRRFDTSEQNAISPGQSALEIKHSCISHSNSKLDHPNSPGHCTSKFAHENSPGAHAPEFTQNSLEAQALENMSKGCTLEHTQISLEAHALESKSRICSLELNQNSLEAQAPENPSRDCQPKRTLERHIENNAAKQDQNGQIQIRPMQNKGVASSLSALFSKCLVILACLLQLSKLTISTVFTVWLLSCGKTQLMKHAVKLILPILGISTRMTDSQLAYIIAAALFSFIVGITLVQSQGHIIKLWKRDPNKMQTA